MSDALSMKNLFPSVTSIYQEISNPPEQHPAEHPYEYIFRVYDDASLNSKLTGLPGFSPPWPIRVVNGLTVTVSYIVFITSVLFVTTLLCTIIAFVIEIISTVEFTVDIPFTGKVLYTLPAETTESFVIVASPVLLTFAIVWGAIVIFTALNKVSSTLSQPYEDEYYEWLEELEPPENGYPAGLAYAWREEEFDYGSIPSSAPPALRSQRKFEVGIYVCKTIWATVIKFFGRMLFFHSAVMYQNMGPPADTVDDMTKESRRRK